VVALGLTLTGCWDSAVRRGRFDQLATNRGFPDLDLMVSSSDQSGVVAVSVTLGDDRGSDGCFVADDGWRVVVDGEELDLRYRGGEASPMEISGVKWQIERCASAQFVSRAGARFRRREVSVVELEHDDRRADAAVRDLFTPRQARLLTAAPFRPGDRLTFEWHPLDDVWIGSGLSASVFLYWPNEATARVERPNLEVDPPRFSFVLPELRPGPIRISWGLTDMEAHPRIIGCRWLRSCYSHGGVSGGQTSILVSRRGEDARPPAVINLKGWLRGP
jgi:hypothetical protein